MPDTQPSRVGAFVPQEWGAKTLTQPGSQLSPRFTPRPKTILSQELFIGWKNPWQTVREKVDIKVIPAGQNSRSMYVKCDECHHPCVSLTACAHPGLTHREDQRVTHQLGNSGAGRTRWKFYFLLCAFLNFPNVAP